MSIPLLSTKLHTPSLRTHLVPRPRLLDLLNQSLHCKLTLVSAPAGYGKTTLLCQWLSECSLPYAWLSLDAADNDPTRFLSYLISALQHIEPDLGSSALDALRSSSVVPPIARSPIALPLTLLLNDLTSASQPFILVLDDYHLIENPRVHELFSYLLDNQPAQMHLVTATRVDPPLPLARLRSQAQLVELRAGDLCFTVREANAILNEIMRLELPMEHVEALEKHTEEKQLKR